MQSAFEDYLLDFVKTYQGSKLSIVATGGGVHLGNLAMVPGSSKVLHSFYCPYETQESVDFINRNTPEAGHLFLKKAVSPVSAGVLYDALWTQNKQFPQVRNLAITASCTTTRYRRGDNQAYIAFQDAETQQVQVWHLKLPKLSEEEHNGFSAEDLYYLRLREDETIAGIALWLACSLEPEVIQAGVKDGFLSRVSL